MTAMEKIPRFFRLLYDHFGAQHWWPCVSGERWEIVAGAVLTQNTAWTNVEKALKNLSDAGITTPEKILLLPGEELEKLIMPAGFFRQKSRYLKEAARFLSEREKEFLQRNDIPAMRRELLALKGVGKETADSILLYAFGKPVFVIDAYTRRFAQRHLLLDGKMPYDDLQAIFQNSLENTPELFNEYHALIVRLCKESCLKKECCALCGELFGPGRK